MRGDEDDHGAGRSQVLHVLVSKPIELSRLCLAAGERSREKGRHTV